MQPLKRVTHKQARRLWVKHSGYRIGSGRGAKKCMNCAVVGGDWVKRLCVVREQPSGTVHKFAVASRGRCKYWEAVEEVPHASHI